MRTDRLEFVYKETKLETFTSFSIYYLILPRICIKLLNAKKIIFSKSKITSRWQNFDFGLSEYIPESNQNHSLESPFYSVERFDTLQFNIIKSYQRIKEFDLILEISSHLFSFKRINLDRFHIHISRF